MKTKSAYQWFLLLALLAGVLFPAASVNASQPQDQPASASQATPADLIFAMNTLRVSYGLPALVEDPIIDAVAQATAATMAAQNLTWHIGNVSGRVQAAGYGGGAKVWATENFSTGFTQIDQIMQVWSDPLHMIPAVNAAYCNIGAGMAKASNGTTYYVLQAAYTSAHACGDYRSIVPTPLPGTTAVPIVPQIIIPVKIATPDADGKIYHVVQPGQSFWAIAIAYKVTIKDIETWNNLSSSASLRVGEKLFIPSSNTAGYFTPTPPGMVQLATPGPDGKIVHLVQVYQTLSTIALAYGIDMQTLLALNNWQADWPLQIGQKLVIRASQVTPTATPRPLTPIQKLTPASDGKYYHTVSSGENLSWIADLYKIKLTDLLSWNNLTSASTIRPGQKLLLNVTPPATMTFTPLPPTITPTTTKVPATSTVTLTPTLVSSSPTAAAPPPAPNNNPSTAWIWLVGLAAGGAVLFFFFSRKK